MGNASTKGGPIAGPTSSVLEAPRMSRLLTFARELQRASTLEELVEMTRTEVEAELGYAHVWFYVLDEEDADEVRLIDTAGTLRGVSWTVVPTIKITGDALMEEALRSDAPIVVEDARTDPRPNKDLVAKIGNRTIVSVPLRLLDAPFGALGTGTFGDEGCRPPTREQLEYLVGMASQLAVAAGRIRFQDERQRAAEKLKNAEERLLRAQKMEAIGRLAGGIAHDFNNVLTVILSYTTLLLDESRPRVRMREQLEMIKSAGERAANLTRQLLALSRHQVAVQRVIDPAATLERSLPLLRSLVGEDVAVITRLAADLHPIRLDPTHLDQVVMNLAVNARDAMPEGGTLTIEAKNVEFDEQRSRTQANARPGPYLMLSVTDTGTGMDAETRLRIFEPFFTTKPEGKGTGLGLSTVFGIVQQSHGVISVESELGNGTRFELYFPKATTTNEPAPTSRTSPAPAADEGGGSETILVVDDQDDVRKVVGDILRGEGYGVLEAANAREAIAVSTNHASRIHLLITDVVMPGMHGHRLAAQLLARRPGLSVLYMSGYSEHPVVHSSAESVAFLQKPILPEALTRRVRELLRGG